MSAEHLIKIFNGLNERFKTNQVQEDTIFYFSLGEGTGEKWTVTVGPDRCEIKEGKQSEQADCFLETSADLFIKMIEGTYQPGITDFMSGKVKSNDPMKLKLLLKVFGVSSTDDEEPVDTW